VPNGAYAELMHCRPIPVMNFCELVYNFSGIKFFKRNDKFFQFFVSQAFDIFSNNQFIAWLKTGVSFGKSMLYIFSGVIDLFVGEFTFMITIAKNSVLAFF
jgi:hypothetical protein